MKRREFLKCMAVTVAAAGLPVSTFAGIYSPIAKAAAQEHFKGFELGKDIELKELGIKYIKDGNNKEYKVLEYQLRKRYVGHEDLVANCEIDKALIDIVPDPQSFIKSELQVFVEAMRQEAINMNSGISNSLKTGRKHD